MADDQILRVGAEFDVSQIVAGAAQASASFQGIGTRVAALTEVLVRNNVAFNSDTAAMLQQAAAADEAASQAAADSAKTETLNGALEAQVAALRAQVAALEQSVIALEAAKAAADRARNSIAGLGSVSGEARAEFGLLEGSTGTLAGGLARVAAQSASLRPLIEAAFPIAAAAGMVAIIGLIGDKIVEATDALAGWDKAAQKAYQEAANANIALLRTNLDQASAEQKQREIGLEGLAKQRQETSDLTSDIQRYSAALGQAQHAVTGIQQEIDKLKEERLGAAFDPAYPLETGKSFHTLGLDIDEANRQLAVQIKLRDELAAKIPALKLALEAAGKTSGIDQSKDAIAAAAAQAAATKTIQEAQLAYAESVTKQEYQDHHITLAQETEELRTEENNRIQIVRDSIAAQQRELEARHKLTGEDIRKPQTALNAEAEAEETAHQSRMAQIDATAAREGVVLDREAATARIEFDKEMSAAYDEAETRKAQTAYKAADSISEIESSELALTTAQTKAVHDQIDALEQEQEVVGRGPRTVEGELADPAQRDKYAKLTVDIAKLSEGLDATLEAGAEETTRRINEIKAQQLTDELTTIEERTRIEIDGMKRTDASVKTSFDERLISSKRYVEAVRSEAADEYQVEAAAIAIEMQRVRAAGDAKVLTEEQVAKRIEELWKQEENARQQMLNQESAAMEAASKRQIQSIEKIAQAFSQDFQRSFEEAARQQGTFHSRMQAFWASMVQGFERMGEQIIANEIKVMAMRLLVHRIGAQAIGQAEQGGAVKAGKSAGITGEIDVAKNAATDAAKVFHEVMEKIPWPVNIALAPISAAAVFAAEMAWGGKIKSSGGGTVGDANTSSGDTASAEQGGIMSADMPLFAHAKEMVLPAHISTALQGAIPAVQGFHEAIQGGLGTSLASIVNNSNTSSTARTVHGPRRTTINFNGGSGGLSHEDIVKTVNAAMRRGEIKAGL